MKIREIEKLRAAALLMVILGHMPIRMPDILVHGYTGVSIFFVISGYVNCHSFENALRRYEDHTGLRAALDYWVSRFFRVVPVVGIWLLLYFVCGHITGALGGSYGDTARFLKEYRWWLGGFYNYHFALSRMGGLFGHLWTMAVEIQFYLFLPFFYLIFRSRKAKGAVCAVLIALACAARFFTPDDLAGKLTHTQMDSLFAGVMLYLYRDRLHFGALDRVPGAAKKAVGACMILALFLLPWRMDYFVSAALRYPVFTLLAAVLVYLAQLDQGWIMGSGGVTERIALWAAGVSFSTYISHVLLYSCVYYNFFELVLKTRFPWLTGRKGTALQALFLVLAALAVGALSRFFIEKPYAMLGKSVMTKYRDRHAAARRDKKAAAS